MESPSFSSKRRCGMDENSFHVMATTHPFEHFLGCYDVFINHCGPDVENTVTSVLYQILNYLGLTVFCDSTDSPLGDSLSTNTQHAIRNSFVHIAIFSKGYAYRRRCLAELCLMLESGAKLVPLFYDVAPSDLHCIDSGVYADAFIIHAQGKSSMLVQWRQALHHASVITGTEFNSSKGKLGDLCKYIGDTVFNEVREAKSKLKFEVPDHPVGLKKAIKDLEAKTSPYGPNNQGNGTIVAIVGKAGIGKTCLAKEFYNGKHPMFCKSSFLFGISQAHETKRMGMMREKLMSDLSISLPLSAAAVRPDSRHGHCGVEMIKYQLDRWYSKPLIVLDGVDHADQLVALSLNEFLSHGALVIVTCRDAKILQSFTTVKIYEMSALDSRDATELLCWHALGQPHPPVGQIQVVEKFVEISEGLPLSLKNLGWGLYSKNTAKCE